MQKFEEIKASVESFRLTIAEKILFEDCANAEFLEWLDKRHDRLMWYVRANYDKCRADMARVEWGNAFDHMIEVGCVVENVKDIQSDKVMPLNDKRIKILKTFLWHCCRWDDELLKHMKVHINEIPKDGEDAKLTAIRNALASISEAMELLQNAQNELRHADIAVNTYLCEPWHIEPTMDIELFEGIDNLTGELNTALTREDGCDIVKCGNITFKEKT